MQCLIKVCINAEIVTIQIYINIYFLWNRNGGNNVKMKSKLSKTFDEVPNSKWMLLTTLIKIYMIVDLWNYFNTMLTKMVLAKSDDENE